MSETSCIIIQVYSLKSQSFSVVLPRKSAGDRHLTSMWCLGLDHVQQAGLSRRSIPVDNITINLFQCKIPTETNEQISYLVSIPECMFYLLRSDRDEPASKQSRYCYQYLINGSHSACFNWTFPFKNLDQYLCDDTLTIQVDATLYCHINTIGEPPSSSELDNVAMGMKSMFADEIFTDLTIKRRVQSAQGSACLSVACLQEDVGV